MRAIGEREMKTNFSKYLKSARRLTILIFLATFGCLLILTAIWAATALVFETIFGNGDESWTRLWESCAKEPKIFYVALTVGALYVVYATLFKLRYLKRLGACGLAEELGGKRIDRSTQNRNEALFNEIVEETAREFDVPAPVVYVLRDEEGLNACVIGGDPESSAILATAGALRLLTRDELQSVVAHEFGHLLNGDVKMNMGLIWALAALQSSTFYALEWIRQTRNDERGGNDREGIGIAIFACLCLIVGLPGFVLASIVRAAISRPQEKRADRTAVEFTRKPLALAGALKKIGGASRGAAVESPRAWETSHLFFGSILADGVGRAFRTHPRLNARILALDPNFDGKFPTVVEETAETGEARESEAKTASGASGPNLKKLAEALVALLEERTPARLDGVEATLGEIPEEVERSLTDFDGARTVVFALLLDRNDRETRRRQLEAIRRSATDGEDADDVQATERAARVEATARAFVGASFTTRATVVRLAIPALKLGTFEEYERFRATADVLCNADGRIDLFEFALRHSAIRELDVWFGITPPPVARYGSFGCVNLSTRTALTYLAARGAEGDEEAARRAFDVGVAALAELEPSAQNLERRRSEEITLEAFKTAVERMAQTTPRLKSNLLTCFFACVAADGRVIEEEAETFDAISLALGVSEPVWRSVADALAAGEKAAVDGE